VRVILVPIKRFISEQESEVFGEVRRTFTFTVRALRLRFLVHVGFFVKASVGARQRGCTCVRGFGQASSHV